MVNPQIRVLINSNSRGLYNRLQKSELREDVEVSEFSTRTGSTKMGFTSISRSSLLTHSIKLSEGTLKSTGSVIPFTREEKREGLLLLERRTVVSPKEIVTTINRRMPFGNETTRFLSKDIVRFLFSFQFIWFSTTFISFSSSSSIHTAMRLLPRYSRNKASSERVRATFLCTGLGDARRFGLERNRSDCNDFSETSWSA